MSDIYRHNVQITNNTTIQYQAKMGENVTYYYNYYNFVLFG